MAIQVTETLEPGHLITSNNRALIVTVKNITAAIAIILYDTHKKVGGLAYVPMPDSTKELSRDWSTQYPAKYMDAALPLLWEQCLALGAQPESTWAKLVGGAQLFNFSGGAGNALNVGSRNLVAARAGLNQLGINLEKADTGGNRAKQVRLTMALGQIAVRRIGDPAEYQI
jgi:chemotaxis protein CheD